MALRGLVAKAGKSSLLRASAGSGVLRASSLMLALITSVLLARVLGADGLGRYSFAIAVVNLASLPIHMGLPVLVIRETAKAETSGEWARMRALWQWAGRRVFKVSLIVIPIVCIGAWLSGDIVVPSGGLEALLWAMPLIPLIAIAHVRAAALRGLHFPILGLMPENLIRPGVHAALLGAALYTGIALNSGLAMSLHVVAAILAFVFGAFVLWWKMPEGVRNVSPARGEQRAWAKALIPLALIAGSQVVIQNANILLLGIWVEPEDIGIFKIATAASNLVTIGLTAVALAVTPTFAKQFRNKNMHALARSSGNAALLAILASLPVALALIIWGRDLFVLVYGAEFAASYAPSIVLVIGQLVNCFFGLGLSILSMTDNERKVLRIYVIALAVNFFLNLALIPVLGNMGAAYATMAGAVTLNILLWFEVRRTLNIDSSALGIFFARQRR